MDNLNALLNSSLEFLVGRNVVIDLDNFRGLANLTEAEIADNINVIMGILSFVYCRLAGRPEFGEFVKVGNKLITSANITESNCEVCTILSIYCDNMDQVNKLFQHCTNYVINGIKFNNTYELALYSRSRARYNPEMLAEHKKQLSHYPLIYAEDLANLA